MGSRLFFFLTGHHNQFSRLQYSAAFIGFDEFNFQVGGILLFLNTFGTEILATLTLPLLASAATANVGRLDPGRGQGQGDRVAVVQDQPYRGLGTPRHGKGQAPGTSNYQGAGSLRSTTAMTQEVNSIGD
ncbi:unnamed protein product, partial [Discosporangium mesarthrocarpum]